jgi:hypothetical protein
MKLLASFPGVPGTLGETVMLAPSKSDCITVLSAASGMRDAGTLMKLDAAALGLSDNTLKATASFLTERGCFASYREEHGDYSIGALSLQGRLRLEQLASD